MVFNKRGMVRPDVVNDLVAQCENSFFVRYFVFMNMDGRYTKRCVFVGEDFLSGDVLVVFPDMYQ